MKRPLLVAYHIVMAGVYANIIMAWHMGWTRLAVGVLAAATTVCVVMGLFICRVVVMYGLRRADSLPTEPRRLWSADVGQPWPDLRGEALDVEAWLLGLSAQEGEPEQLASQAQRPQPSNGGLAIGGDAQVKDALITENACNLGDVVLSSQVFVRGDTNLYGTGMGEAALAANALGLFDDKEWCNAVPLLATARLDFSDISSGENVAPSQVHGFGKIRIIY